MDGLDFPHLGATREEGRIDRVVARDKIGHNGLGPLFLLAKTPSFPSRSKKRVNIPYRADWKSVMVDWFRL